MTAARAHVRAAVCREFGSPLVVEALELEPPRASEVRVNLAACAICYSDVAYADGAWDGYLPAVYGHEAAGVVEEVGAGVDRVRPGDHVVVTMIRSCGQCDLCSRGEPALCEAEFPPEESPRLRDGDGRRVEPSMYTGAFAEAVVVHGSQVVQVAEDLPLDLASLLGCGVLTGVGAVINTAAVPAGTDVVVVGAGGVGLNSVQGAAIAGARTIVAVDPLEEKREAALAFGATHTVDPGREAAADAVRAITGRGADYVFVTVGAKAAIEAGPALLRRGGTLVLVGMPAYGVTVELDPTDLAHNGRRILGSKMGSARPDVDIPRLVELYRDGRLKLRELVSGRYPLGEINDAIASAKRGEALRNLIVF